ncbi:hypothetical protein TNCV_2711771 [Trichonephila clavipes]|nr:hypothetical protein TNCV_2711771 [Trichonephila clavipes]
MGLQFLFMDDNAPCHRTVAAEQLLESEDIERMDWPARSPDLNPIEHVWDFLGRRLAARTLPPVTIRELRLALQDEWAAMPQQLIDTLILSMGRRCGNANQAAEIGNGVYGLDIVTSNYVQFWFRRFHSGMPVVENVDKITQMIEVDQHVSSCSIAQKLKIDPKSFNRFAQSWILKEA